MKYSAGIVSHAFWLSETRKTAELLVAGEDLKQIRFLAQTENIYQVKNETRALRIANAIVQRLESLPKVLMEQIAKSDIGTAKLLILISFMKTDLLFFEFMHEVYRPAILMGEYIITDRAINAFFDEKKGQSETVAKWIDTTINRLERCYIGILREAGLLKIETDVRKIIIPLVDYNLRKQMEDNELTTYLNAVTGEA